MPKTNNSQNSKKSKLWIIVIIILLLAGAGAVWWFCLGGQEAVEDDIADTSPEPLYSNLTGLEIDNPAINSMPTFCIQIPNGSTDGARPQVGLNDAAVVFEAIAETGITRFAAIFQNPESQIIGPIRSLRPYYLEWDTPFDCTVVHDGGSDEALAAVGNGRYRNLDEDFDYMWKENYIDGAYRYWNNVFTSPTKLLSFNQTHDYTTSNPKVFPRLRPSEVAEDLAARSACSEENSECDLVFAELITTKFTSLTDYSVDYTYDAETNTYHRSYQNGEEHRSYYCTSEEISSCTLQSVAPSAVAVMRVEEHTMSDNYHESIKTVGRGNAYVFQNGTVIEGSWEKSSIDSQIIFRDADGAEVKFTHGQLWIAAVPQFGSVSWE